MEVLTESLIIGLFVCGVIMFVWDDINLFIIRFKLRHRLKSLHIKQKQLPKPVNYVVKLIGVGFKNDKTRIAFCILEIFIMVTTFVISVFNFSPLFSLFAAALAAGMPLLLLASRFEASRAKQSHEGISFVTELRRQYRICNLNMCEAMEKLVATDGDFKLTSDRVYKLLLHMRSASGTMDVRDAVDHFVFSFGTSWARMLGHCILLSSEKGLDVSAGLADIADQLNEARKIEEKKSLLNSESTRMTLLLIPLMYAACMFTAVYYLNISPVKLLQNQFLNSTAFTLFLLIVFIFVINYLIIFMLGNSRLDY